MNFKIFEFEDLTGKEDEPIKEVKFGEDKDNALKLISLKKHTEIPPHSSSSDVCVYVVSGEIEIIFNKIDNCICETCHCEVFDEYEEAEKKFKIGKGQFFFFGKDYMHMVKALKDSEFMVIKI